jgi:hypothetical protein
MQPCGGQSLFESGPIGALAGLHLGELGDNRPAPAIEVRRDSRALCLDAETALALLAGADAVIRDEFPVVLCHGRLVTNTSTSVEAFVTPCGWVVKS